MCDKVNDPIIIVKKMLSKYGTSFVAYDQPILFNDTLNDAFNNIAIYNRIIFCFDIEFHNIVLNNKNNNYQNPKVSDRVWSYLNDYQYENKGPLKVAQFIREIGILIFAKEEGRWSYLGYIFKNFPTNKRSNLENDTQYMSDDQNTILVLSKYATVTPKTKQIMEKNDSLFNIHEFINNITLDTLNKKTFNIINDFINKYNYVEKILNKDEFMCIRQNLKLLKKLILNNNDNVEQTEKQLKNIIKNLLSKTKDIPFRIYGKILDKDPKIAKIFNYQMSSYLKDPLVVDRTLNVKEAKELISMWEQIDKYTCYVVKGKHDIVAINNVTEEYFEKKIIKFWHTYDIEIFNRISTLKYGSAQLANTYIGIQSSPYYNKGNSYNDTDNINIKDLDKIVTNHLPSSSPHNPAVDSLYTIIVALTMMTIINNNL